jgi:hypothetical protein
MVCGFLVDNDPPEMQNAVSGYFQQATIFAAQFYCVG